VYSCTVRPYAAIIRQARHPVIIHLPESTLLTPAYPCERRQYHRNEQIDTKERTRADNSHKIEGCGLCAHMRVGVHHQVIRSSGHQVTTSSGQASRSITSSHTQKERETHTHRHTHTHTHTDTHTAHTHLHLCVHQCIHNWGPSFQ